jgi:Domain of unknown function (DUF4129)
MSESTKSIPELTHRPFSPIALYNVIVSLMMVCFTATIIQFGLRLVPTWKGSYLLVVCFLVTLAGLFSTRVLRDESFLSREWLVQVVSEWVVILLAIKAAIYLVNNPAQLFIDIPLWGKDFLGSFFTGEYLIAIAMTLFFWFIASFFSDKFQKLENDPELLEQERNGFLVINRQQVRKSLLTMIFSLGGVMLFLVTLSKVSLPFLSTTTTPTQINILLLISFFLLGMILLSQSQYSILNAHWYIESIPNSPKIASFWFPASLILLVLIALIVYFLPTRYSVGLLALLQSLISMFLIFLTFLSVLIITPLVAFLAFLASLLGSQKGVATQATPAAPIPPQPQIPSAPVPWWELVKAIIFWLIFLSVIIFALRYYISQSPSLMNFFANLGIGAKLSSFWNWLKHRLHRINQGVSNMVSSGLERIRSLRVKSPVSINPLDFIARNLPARHRVLLIYLAMIRFNNRFGIQRRKSQTPYEYAQMLLGQTPTIKENLDVITGSFIEARYTRHIITNDQANTTQTAWENMQKTLNEFFEQQKQNQE